MGDHPRRARQDISPTTLRGREPAVVNAIHDRRENTLFLPGFPLPGPLSVTLDLPAAVAGADFVVVAVPSPHVRGVLADARGSIAPHALVVSVTKGIEAGTGRRMTEVITETLGDHDPRHDRVTCRTQPRPRGDGRTPLGDLRGVR